MVVLFERDKMQVMRKKHNINFNDGVKILEREHKKLMIILYDMTIENEALKKRVSELEYENKELKKVN